MKTVVANLVLVCLLIGAVLAQDNKAAGASKEAPTNAVVQQVARAVNGTTSDTPAPDASKSAAVTTAAKPEPKAEKKASDAPAGDKRSAAPAQQPLLAGAPKRAGQPASKSAGQPTVRFAAPSAAWQQTSTSLSFNPLSNQRILSPLCSGDAEATACGSFSGNTAVVVSSVMPAIGTNTNVKTTQCFCDFRNTVNGFLPANGNEVYRCAVYCQ